MTAHPSEPRALATLSVLAVVPWTLFHLWREWAALAGREVWLARARSGGPVVVVLEIAAVLALAALVVLATRALFRGGPLPGHALDEADGPLVRILAGVSRPALGALSVFVVIHAIWLGLPRLGGAGVAETYEALRIAAGTPFLVVVHAIGLSALALHVAASIPAWLVATERVTSREGRRSAALVSAGLATCLLVLFVQLYGWHATGAGAVWPVTIVDSDAALE